MDLRGGRDGIKGDFMCPNTQAGPQPSCQVHQYFVLIVVTDPGWNPGEGRMIFLFYSRVGDSGQSVTRI